MGDDRAASDRPRQQSSQKGALPAGRPGQAADLARRAGALPKVQVLTAAFV